jgi:hypothetical protein
VLFNIIKYGAPIIIGSMYIWFSVVPVQKAIERHGTKNSYGKYPDGTFKYTITKSSGESATLNPLMRG